MRARCKGAYLLGAVGLLLLVGSACSKSVQSTGMEGNAAPAVKRAAPAPTKPGTTMETASTPIPSLSGVDSGDSLATGRGSGEQKIPAGNIVVAKADSPDAARRQAEDLQRDQLATAAAGLEDVFFGYDSWQLTAEAKQALMLDAEWMKGNPNRVVLIEGHCDERGTLAYNLVLGEKRAKAVQKYLAELGINQGRMSVVSYGKERPFCKDTDESCHQKNRRGHIVLRVK